MRLHAVRAVVWLGCAWGPCGTLTADGDWRPTVSHDRTTNNNNKNVSRYIANSLASRASHISSRYTHPPSSSPNRTSPTPPPPPIQQVPRRPMVPPAPRTDLVRARRYSPTIISPKKRRRSSLTPRISPSAQRRKHRLGPVMELVGGAVGPLQGVSCRLPPRRSGPPVAKLKLCRKKKRPSDDAICTAGEILLRRICGSEGFIRCAVVKLVLWLFCSQEATSSAARSGRVDVVYIV